MNIKIFFAVVLFAALFISWFYFTVKLSPQKKRRERQKWVRVIEIACSLGLISLALVSINHVSIAAIILISAFALERIYRGLKGWLF